MKRILAELLFVIHTAVVAAIVFGWLFPSLWPYYMSLLVATLVSDALLGYCVLSKWEFDLRRSINPKLRYDYTFSSYYTYKLTHRRLRESFVTGVVYTFLSSSIAINLWVHYGMVTFV